MATKRYPFIISDESVVNSYGFRVLTSGIRLTQFRKNNIVLWMHKRPSRWDGNDKDKEIFPIGTAHNLRREGGKLLADIEFDQHDEFAKKIEQKVEAGVIKMSSPGLLRVSTSTDKKHLLPGQTRATLTQSELVEISIVDIGSNPNALKLYNENTEVVKLSAEGSNDFIPLLNSNTNSNTKTTMDPIQQLAVMLGLNADTAQDKVLEEAKKQINLAAKYDTLKSDYDTLKGDHDTLMHSEITKLVDSNVDVKYKAEQREVYLTIGKESGMATLNTVLDNLPDLPGRVIDKLKRKQQQVLGAGGDDTYKDFETLARQPENVIAKYKEEHPDEYEQLYNDWMSADQ